MAVEHWMLLSTQYVWFTSSERHGLAWALVVSGTKPPTFAASDRSRGHDWRVYLEAWHFP